MERRDRFTRQTTGKRVTPTERDVLWFQKIQRHGPLPSTYLYQFGKHLAHDKLEAHKRLGDLFHEDTTPHRGPYLDRPAPLNPAGGFRQESVSEINDRALSLLRERSLLETDRGLAVDYRPFTHNFMVGCITASIELAAQEAGLEFISAHRILKGKALRLPCQVSYTHPNGKSDRCDNDLTPDALFGLKYPNGKARFFMLEADRATEPLERETLEWSSYLRKILQYEQVINEGTYKKEFNIPSLLILNVTVSEQRAKNILALTKRVTGNNSYQLTQYYPLFASYLQIPKPMPELVTGPWKRVLGDFFIDKV